MSLKLRSAQLFPKAKFVYISRHPYDVFSSACHMADTTYWYTYLNTPTDEQVQDFVLGQYDILWDEYEEGASEIEQTPPSSVHPIF